MKKAAFGFAFVLVLAVARGASAPTPAHGPAPAQVARKIEETALNTITLTGEAERRLGIKLAKAERRPVPCTRLFSGEVIPPLPDQSGLHGQSAYPVIPTLLPADLIRLAQQQIDADGRVAAAAARADGARRALDRAERLFQSKAGSERAVEEARTAAEVADTETETARAQRALLGPPLLPAGGAGKVWIRVPVYAGDVGSIDRDARGAVAEFSSQQGRTLEARPVANPPSSRAPAPTVDLYYEVEDAAGSLRLGQRIGVLISLRAREGALAIPWNAVVHDIYGGTWVYMKAGPLAYARRRVEVARVSGADAVIEAGLDEKDEVVTDGAAELFGTEFGAGK
ncbi:MAG TPA: membrane fusion protein MtrC [Verrucomicrobiae bacterium]|nr:membrane fusion protein MtrC [Verrucomicrobiae bacterium]